MSNRPLCPLNPAQSTDLVRERYSMSDHGMLCSHKQPSVESGLSELGSDADLSSLGGTVGDNAASEDFRV